jgi:hypothetical protein
VQGSIPLSTSLYTNTSIEVLDVSGNNMKQGARDLVAALRLNSTIKTLVLGKNDLGERFEEVLPLLSLLSLWRDAMRCDADVTRRT